MKARQITSVTDNSPRPITRRASLPALTSPRPLTSPGVPTTGRQRRLSVVTPPTRSRLELLNASTSENIGPRITSSQTSLDLKTTGTNGRRNSLRRASQSSDGSDERSGSRSARRPSTSTAPPDGMTHDDNRRGSTSAAKVMSTQAQPVRKNSKSGIEAQPKPNGSKSPSRNNGERRNSFENGSKAPSINGKMPRRGSKSSEADVSHNETIRYVHRDGQEPILVSDKESVPAIKSENDVDSEGSMFDRAKGRRASEPALGGHFLRDLQAKVNVDESSEVKTHHALSPGNEELRKSIVKDLPSTIVAEEDEDRYNEENKEAKLTENSVSQTKESETNTNEEGEIKANADVKPKKIGPLIRQNSNVKSEKERGKCKSAKQNGRVSIQEDSVTEKKQASKPERASIGKTVKQRRKSEGDVLRFAHIWKMQANGGKLSKTDGRYETSNESESPKDFDKMGIWDAVRKCRYIRGYNPPDMSEPEDLSAYVFGQDSVITTE